MLRVVADAGTLSGHAVRYRAEPAAALRIVPLDSLTAVYHRRAGQTHLLAAPLPELLAVIDGDPLGLDEILAKLMIDDDAEARAILSARLTELVEAGLVTRT